MTPVTKKLVSAVAGTLIGGFGLTTLAQADPINFITGPFSFKYANYEFASAPATGDTIGGIFSVSSIQNAVTSTNMWNSGSTGSSGDGTFLNGFFSNITITGFNPSGGNFTATGGLLVMYDVSTAINASTFNSVGIDTTNQLCGGAACPAPWVTALFVPGYGWTPVAFDSTITTAFDGTNTLFGNFSSTNPIGGTGNGYLSVAGLGGMTVTNGNGGSNFTLPASFTGSANGFFDSNGYTFTGGPGTPPSPADLLLKSNFNQCGFQNSPSGCDALPGGPQGPTPIPSRQDTAWSNDPVTGRPVPEPGTLALIGIALAGIGASLRRDRRKLG